MMVMIMMTMVVVLLLMMMIISFSLAARFPWWRASFARRVVKVVFRTAPPLPVASFFPLVRGWS